MQETTLSEQLLDIIFPASCLNCGTHGRPLCSRCMWLLAGQAADLVEGLYGQAAHTVPAFNGFRAAGEYGGLLKEMVLRLKSSQRPLALPLSRLMLAAAGNEPAYLAPERVFFVPSDKWKMKQRGYNPAEVLARLVARHIGRPLEDSLRKAKHTMDQGGLSARQRWKNVEGAFVVAAGAGVSGRVLLVDDVLTTGATVDSCTRALVSAGADCVNVLVAARARFDSRMARFQGDP